MGTDLMGSNSFVARLGNNGSFARVISILNTILILFVVLMVFVIRAQDMAELRQSLEVARQERRDLQKSIDELNKNAIRRP